MRKVFCDFCKQEITPLVPYMLMEKRRGHSMTREACQKCEFMLICFMAAMNSDPLLLDKSVYGEDVLRAIETVVATLRERVNHGRMKGGSLLKRPATARNDTVPKPSRKG